MIVFPNAKINLGLHVVRRRSDGYHDLQTLFYPVLGLNDELEIETTQGDDIQFSNDGIEIDCNAEDNLIVRCYRSMKEHYPSIGGVSVRLSKHIPFGAGLGGGSSDAAFMAKALNAMYDLHLNNEQLSALVRPLGADCPFFIYNTPCWARGIGDLLTPTPLRLNGYFLLMLKPPFPVSTRTAYAGMQPTGTEQQWQADGSDWLTYTNDFETTVFQQFPLLAEIKSRLLASGANYAAMSGSGSTIFALFDKQTLNRNKQQVEEVKNDFSQMIIYQGYIQ
ncbi:MAG: 4-(cytidine 5'-diphospho)-2-C-methyl-D-erythritol kinase [Paludibacteraceae bacterium]|nr:4-(cytidine 5'-diphospho)-2-C-methyl-D-erythritol kinase [Paludibacteraceae bacterium]